MEGTGPQAGGPDLDSLLLAPATALSSATHLGGASQLPAVSEGTDRPCRDVSVLTRGGGSGQQGTHD